MMLKLSRRQFLANSIALLGAGGMGGATRAWAQGAPPPLPIPQLMDGSNGEPLNLTIRQGSWAFTSGINTPTLGISQNYLAPTIRARRGSELNLHYRNTLGEGVAMHGHGLHVPGDVDGGPQLEMPPGEVWQPRLDIVQPAATCWYHAHTHGKTGEQVYRGLAGMIIIDDDDSAALDLPHRYGIDDLPIIIQDRTFDAQGRLVYSPDEAGQDGWLGDTVVINGKVAPHAKVPAGKIRLRVLNGANARFYVASFADQRVFYKIASDGGLLPAPQPMQSMEMGPGERCEIIVDMLDGATAQLLARFEDDVEAEEEDIAGAALQYLGLADSPPRLPSLTLQVDAALPAHTAPLPQKMATIALPKPGDIARTRDFMLTMAEDKSTGGGHGAMSMNINGEEMNMKVINEQVPMGEWERWRFRSNFGQHPFHVHGCSFLVEQIEGGKVDPAEIGWKDMIILDDDAWSEIIVRFDHPATKEYPYMYHCHILEHEDRGMMGQFTVS